MAIIISKSLTKTDIESYLAFPTSSLGPLPFQEGHSMNMNVYDNNGCEWIFCCTIQRNDSFGQFLAVGWIEFVRHKNLRENDHVTILDEEEIIQNKVTTSTRVKIEVKRKIRLFGTDIWADV